jgi:hypothetical protein
MKNYKWDAARRAWFPTNLARMLQHKLLLVLVVAFALSMVAAVTQIDLVTQVKGILPTGNGGTGNAFFAVSGPSASTKTYTFPNASATMEYQANKNAASGYAGLDGSSKLTLSQMQEVMGVADLSDFNGKSGSGTTAIGATITSPATNECLKWDGSKWVNGTCASFNFADAETPTGTVDGSNAVFTLAHTPSPSASLAVYKNGQLMIAGASADYTLSTATITYATAAKPQTGDVHIAFYRW